LLGGGVSVSKFWGVGWGGGGGVGGEIKGTMKLLYYVYF